MKTLGGVAALLSAAMMLAGCGSSSGKTGAASDSFTPYSFSAAPEPPTEETEAPTLDPSASLAAEVSVWFSTVEDKFTAVGDDQTTISQAADDEEAIEGCVQLKRDVVTFQTAPASPDPETRTYLARAMDAYSTAATHCIDSDFESAGEDLMRGTKYIKKASTRIRDLTP